MGASVELQKAVVAKLFATAAVTSQLAAHAFSAGKKAIYDDVPQAASPESVFAFPYVVVGDTTEIPFDADDFVGRESTITIHSFSRYRGKKEVKTIMDAVKAALHEQPLAVTGETTILVHFDFAEIVPDPDGRTRHGVQRFRVITVGT